MVLLTGFMDLGRIYFCSHSNKRKTNWIWFLFQHYIALFFGNKTLNSLLWSLSHIYSVLQQLLLYCPQIPGRRWSCPLSWEGQRALLEVKARWWVGEARWLFHHPTIHMGWGMVPGKGIGSDYSSWKVIAGLSWSNLGGNTEGRQDWSGSAAVLSASRFGVEAGETLQRTVCSSLKFPSFIPHLTFFFQLRKRTKYSEISLL